MSKKERSYGENSDELWTVTPEKLRREQRAETQLLTARLRNREQEKVRPNREHGSGIELQVSMCTRGGIR